MTFAKVRPMAFVMIAGPQILSAVFLATSTRWARDSLAYIGGAAFSITFFVTLAFLLGGAARNAGASHTAESGAPKWMGKLQTATPGLASKLGVLLLGITISNLA